MNGGSGISVTVYQLLAITPVVVLELIVDYPTFVAARNPTVGMDVVSTSVNGIMDGQEENALAVTTIVHRSSRHPILRCGRTTK